MTKYTYKRLFEIRILLEYFLMGEDREVPDAPTVEILEYGKPFFEISLAKQKLRLQNALNAVRYDVRKVLDIAPTPETEQFLRNQRMRMIQTPLGFFIGTEVNEEKDNNGTTYKPFIPLSGDAPLVFSIKVKAELFNNYTNLPLTKRVPAICLFSNRNGRKTGNFLALPPPAKPANLLALEMGELFLDNNQVYEVTYALPPDGDGIFSPVAGDGCPVKPDKRLLPKKFGYQFPQAISKEAVFILKKDGFEKIITKPAGAPYRFVSLDFTYDKDTGADKKPIPDGEYQLEVLVDNQPEDHVLIELNNAWYDTGNLGVIAIYPKAGGAEHAAFDLLDAEGKLKTRLDANGLKQPHPAFELRFFSRKTYWRYLSKTDFKYDEFSQDIKDVLVKQAAGNVLVTKKPRAFSQNLTRFSKSLVLANASPVILKLESGRYLSDIHTSAVNKL